MVDDYKIENLEFAAQIAFGRLEKARSELAIYNMLTNSLKIKLDKIDHDSPKYYALKYEYDDALEEQQNLECSVKYLEEEYNSLRAELKKYDD